MSMKESSEPLFGEMGKNWFWLLILGILFIGLGIAGLGRLIAFSVAGTLFFGALMIVGGIAQFLEAFKFQTWKSMIFHILIAVIYVGGGIFVMQQPVTATVLLTWVLAVVFVAVGIVRIIMALQMRATGGWFMPALGGVFSIVLGLLIYAGWPYTGLKVIGLFIAIDLILNGWSYIWIAFTARKLNKALTATA